MVISRFFFIKNDFSSVCILNRYVKLSTSSITKQFVIDLLLTWHFLALYLQIPIFLGER